MTINKQIGQPEEDFILWECPDCEYLIPLDSLILRRDDFGCPRCGRLVGNFKILQGEPHD